MLKIFSLTLAVLIAPVPSHAATSKTYDEIVSFMKGLAVSHPKNVTLFDLAISDSGKMIQGVKIGNGPVKNLVVGTHHGNEYGATEVAKAFAASVAESPIVGQTLYVLPVLNITGYDSRNRQETLGDTSVDPNRDYPGPCVAGSPFRLKSTAALANFVAQQGIVASATLHTFYPAVVYPWGISSHDLSTPYPDMFTQLVQAATEESHYQTGNSTEVIYPADGTFEDYAFWKHGIWSLLFELGNSHTPTDEDLDMMQKVNVPGLRRMLELAPRQRAENHGFAGKCDMRLMRLDRHNE